MILHHLSAQDLVSNLTWSKTGFSKLWATAAQGISIVMGSRKLRRCLQGPTTFSVQSICSTASVDCLALPSVFLFFPKCNHFHYWQRGTQGTEICSPWLRLSQAMARTSKRFPTPDLEYFQGGMKSASAFVIPAWEAMGDDPVGVIS